MDQHHHNQQNHPEALSASTEMLQPIQGPSIPIKGLRNEKKVAEGTKKLERGLRMVARQRDMALDASVAASTTARNPRGPGGSDSHNGRTSNSH